MSQSTWEGTEMTRPVDGCPAASDDTCSILVPRHLLIWQDELSHCCGAVHVDVSEKSEEGE